MLKHYYLTVDSNNVLPNKDKIIFQNVIKCWYTTRTLKNRKRNVYFVL